MTCKPTKFCVMLNEQKEEYLVSAGYHKTQGAACADSPDATLSFLEDAYQASHQAQECVWLIVLNCRLRVIGTFEMTRGSSESTMFPIREIMKNVLLCGGTRFIIAHNHPSGDTSPSECDTKSTKNLIEAARTLEVVLLDHLIIGRDGCYFSYRENMNDLFCCKKQRKILQK